MKEISDSKKQILVINTACIGDLVLNTPALRVLKNNFPNSHISMLVNKRYKEMLEGNPNLDQIIALDKRGEHKSFSGMWKLIRLIQSKELDLVVNYSISERSIVTVALSGAKRKLGYFPFNLKLGKRGHIVNNQLELLKKLKLKNYDHQGLEVFPAKVDEQFAKAFLQENGVENKDILIGLNPGASWPNKKWSIEGFSSLADQIVKRYGAKIILFGGPEDLMCVENISNMMQARSISAAGKTTLRQLAALLKRCKLLVTGDTGPMHISIGVRTPVVALFGPSPLELYGPYGEEHTVIRKNLPCSPCKENKNCAKHDCMKLITVEEVMEAVEKYMRGV